MLVLFVMGLTLGCGGKAVCVCFFRVHGPCTQGRMENVFSSGVLGGQGPTLGFALIARSLRVYFHVSSLVASDKVICDKIQWYHIPWCMRFLVPGKAKNAKNMQKSR